MKLGPSKPYRDMTPEEQKNYQARCRLADANGLHYLLYAHGLKRLYQQFTEDGQPFAIISAPDKAEAFRTFLKDSDQGYLPAWGVWIPAEGDPSGEHALFIPGMDRYLAIKLGQSFGSEAVIWGNRGEYRVFDLKAIKESGPFSVAERFRCLRLGKGLEPEPWPPGVADRWRFRPAPDSPLILESTHTTSTVRTNLARNSMSYPSAPKRLLEKGRHFFFWRAGGGWISTMQQPLGVAVHNRAMGPVLSCGCGMRMGQLDAYVPLWPTAETEAQIELLRTECRDAPPAGGA